MQIVLAISVLLFIVTSTLVGLRMLLLSRRTGGRPELLMGAGMALIGGIGYPGGVASGFGQASVGHVHFAIWAVSTACTQLGIGLIYAFTWQVFRPSAAWAKAVVLAGCALMAASYVASAHALLTAPADLSSALAARSATLIGLAGYAGCFLWTAIEGFENHRRARRRLALGLADPVVVSRFFLWGLFGLMATCINVVSVISQMVLGQAANAPAVMLSMGIFGGAASVAMYLAFFAPAWYLARVQRRAARAGTASGV